MTGKASNVANFIRGKAQLLVAEMVLAERKNIGIVKDAARLYSSGPYSLRELAQMGHPYAKRAPNPPLPPEILNMQSGEVMHSWASIGPTHFLTQGALRSSVFNQAFHARFLEAPGGTRLMIERPVVAGIEREVEAKVERNRQAALRRAFRP